MALTSAILSNNNATLTLNFSSDPGAVPVTGLTFGSEIGTDNSVTGPSESTGLVRTYTILNPSCVTDDFDVTSSGTTQTTTGHVVVYPSFNVRYDGDVTLHFNPPSFAQEFSTAMANNVNGNTSQYNSVRFRAAEGSTFIGAVALTAGGFNQRLWDYAPAIDSTAGTVTWDRPDHMMVLSPTVSPVDSITTIWEGDSNFTSAAGVDVDLMEFFSFRETPTPFFRDQTWNNNATFNSTAGGIYANGVCVDYSITSASLSVDNTTLTVTLANAPSTALTLNDFVLPDGVTANSVSVSSDGDVYTIDVDPRSVRSNFEVALGNTSAVTSVEYETVDQILWCLKAPGVISGTPDMLSSVTPTALSVNGTDVSNPLDDDGNSSTPANYYGARVYARGNDLLIETSYKKDAEAFAATLSGHGTGNYNVSNPTLVLTDGTNSISVGSIGSGSTPLSSAWSIENMILAATFGGSSNTNLALTFSEDPGEVTGDSFYFDTIPASAGPITVTGTGINRTLTFENPENITFSGNIAIGSGGCLAPISDSFISTDRKEYVIVNTDNPYTSVSGSATVIDTDYVTHRLAFGLNSVLDPGNFPTSGSTPFTVTSDADDVRAIRVRSEQNRLILNAPSVAWAEWVAGWLSTDSLYGDATEYSRIRFDGSTDIDLTWTDNAPITSNWNQFALLNTAVLSSSNTVLTLTFSDALPSDFAISDLTLPTTGGGELFTDGTLSVSGNVATITIPDASSACIDDNFEVSYAGIARTTTGYSVPADVDTHDYKVSVGTDSITYRFTDIGTARRFVSYINLHVSEGRGVWRIYSNSSESIEGADGAVVSGFYDPANSFTASAAPDYTGITQRVYRSGSNVTILDGPSTGGTQYEASDTKVGNGAASSTGLGSVALSADATGTAFRYITVVTNGTGGETIHDAFDICDFTAFGGVNIGEVTAGVDGSIDVKFDPPISGGDVPGIDDIEGLPPGTSWEPYPPEDGNVGGGVITPPTTPPGTGPALPPPDICIRGACIGPINPPPGEESPGPTIPTLPPVPGIPAPAPGVPYPPITVPIPPDIPGNPPGTPLPPIVPPAPITPPNPEAGDVCWTAAVGTTTVGGASVYGLILTFSDENENTPEGATAAVAWSTYSTIASVLTYNTYIKSLTGRDSDGNNSGAITLVDGQVPPQQQAFFDSTNNRVVINLNAGQTGYIVSDFETTPACTDINTVQVCGVDTNTESQNICFRASDEAGKVIAIHASYPGGEYEINCPAAGSTVLLVPTPADPIDLGNTITFNRPNHLALIRGVCDGTGTGLEACLPIPGTPSADIPDVCGAWSEWVEGSAISDDGGSNSVSDWSEWSPESGTEFEPEITQTRTRNVVTTYSNRMRVDTRTRTCTVNGTSDENQTTETRTVSLDPTQETNPETESRVRPNPAFVAAGNWNVIQIADSQSAPTYGPYTAWSPAPSNIDGEMTNQTRSRLCTVTTWVTLVETRLIQVDGVFSYQYRVRDVSYGSRSSTLTENRIITNSSFTRQISLTVGGSVGNALFELNWTDGSGTISNLNTSFYSHTVSGLRNNAWQQFGPQAVDWEYNTIPGSTALLNATSSGSTLTVTATNAVTLNVDLYASSVAGLITIDDPLLGDPRVI